MVAATTSTPALQLPQLLLQLLRDEGQQCHLTGNRGGQRIMTWVVRMKSTAVMQKKKGPRDVSISWATGKFIYFHFISLLLTKTILGSDFTIDDNDWHPLTHPHLWGS
jgi:hypothetical protein